MASNIPPRFLIIDGHSLIHRAFHAIQDLSTRQGERVNAVFGFAMILLNTIKRYQPKYAAVAFDVHAPTFRDKKYDQYKVNRSKTDPELHAQFDRVRQLVTTLGLPIFEQAGYEADDMIGSLSAKLAAEQPDLEVVILTSDKDILQLVTDHVKVITPGRRVTDETLYDPKKFEEKFGFPSIRMIDYKGLRGDPSDNIPGVKGVGEKTATQLLQQFDSLENLYQEMDTYGGLPDVKERIVKLLQDHREEAELSYWLATIVQDVPITYDLRDCQLDHYDRQAAMELFRELEFQSLMRLLPEPQVDFNLQRHSSNAQASSTSAPNSSSNTGGNEHSGSSLEKMSKAERKVYPVGEVHLVQTEQEVGQLVTQIRKEQRVTFDLETSSLDPLTCDIIGIALSFDGSEAWYLPFGHEPVDAELFPDIHEEEKKNLAWDVVRELVRPIFEDRKIEKIAHNMKFDAKVLISQGIAFNGYAFDTMIAAYLLHAGVRSYGLKHLAFVELGWLMKEIESLIGEKKKGKQQLSFAQVPVSIATQYAGEDALATALLYEIFSSRLQHLRTSEHPDQASLNDLFQQVEMPLIPVLVEMELNGICLDTDFLQEMSGALAAGMKNIEDEVASLAGEPFNISSTKQLQEVLFEKLGVKKTKRIKTGYSTNASSLEKIQQEHPIIPLVLQYRELTKLQSTYVEALPPMIHQETGRIHTSFNQTIAATGRLSSSDPNLQNIPIRTELGRKVRQAFVAPEGKKILAIDYSQVEFRVLAHMAQDPVLIKAFQEDEDIHTTTAAKIFNTYPEQVTKDQRRVGKTVNFGLVYGQTKYGLKKQLNISTQEAEAFILNFHANFPETSAYFEKLKMEARAKGYVHTLLGRIRHIPDIESPSVSRREAAERMAINMPVQGTAADIMKIAMIRVSAELKKRYVALPFDQRPLLLLQVHDEVVLEVPDDLLEEVSSLVREQMEQAYSLDVPLKVDVEVGRSWGELSEKVS